MRDQIVGLPTASFLRELLLDHVDAFAATQQRVETRIGHPLRAPQRLDQRLPAGVVLDLDRAPHVVAQAREDTRMAPSRCAGCRCDAAPRRSRNNSKARAHEIDRRFELRQLDILSFAGAGAMEDGGQQPDQRVARIGDVIGIVRAGADRRPVRGAGHLDQPGDRRDGRAEPDIALVRAGAALHRHGEVDQRRIGGRKLRVAEPPALHDAGPEIVGDDRALRARAFTRCARLRVRPC